MARNFIMKGAPVHTRHFIAVLALVLVVADAVKTSSNRLVPRIHFTPPCFYNQGGPHDIAATLYENETQTWHVMAGCWSMGGWQHLTSKDLVRWEVVGTPKPFGGTGGLVQDDSGNIVAYAMTGGAIHFWVASNLSASIWTESATAIPGCCNDPIIWKSNDTWYATTANHGGPKGGTGNFGYESFYSSPALLGPESNWTEFMYPFFTNNESILVPGHPQQKEFVSPDYFTNIPGTSSPNTGVFLSSIYGEMGTVSGIHRNGIYNFAVFFVGSQPHGDGTPFKSKSVQAVDWSCFSPSNVTAGGLDLAWDYGPTQFGCCPKTAGGTDRTGHPRRVMFGWQQNGCSDGGSPNSNAKENAMTLPRLLFTSKDGQILQQFVPELNQLRIDSSHYSVSNLEFPSGGVKNAVYLPAAAHGSQLEISATINFENTTGVFGFLVLAGPREWTVIGFDSHLGQTFVDRRMSSGGKFDADIRAGPWDPQLGGGAVSISAFVDNSIVAFIVDNKTTLSVWVHPQLNTSIGVATFASIPGVIASQLDIWQLDDANPNPYS